jgi:hypothetical protein
MANEIQKVKPVSQEAIARFDEACQEYGGLALREMADATKAIKLADAIQAIESALSPEIMTKIMALQGRRVGFKTDRDKNKDGTPGPGYSVAVVKDVMVEAVLLGARPTGNEINIIAGGCYLTKEHFTRKVFEIPGLTDLELTFGVPKITGDQAAVNCRAKWKLNGVEQSIGCDEQDPCTIVVRVWDGKGGGIDQAIGKAERKLRVRIWQRATGSRLSMPDADVAEVEAEARVVGSSGLPRKKKDAPAEQEQPKESEADRKAMLRAQLEEAKMLEAKADPQQDAGDVQAHAEPEQEGTRRSPPPAYARLYAAYDNHAKLIDQLLMELDLPTLPSMIWQDLDEEQLVSLGRASARFAKKISEG